MSTTGRTGWTWSGSTPVLSGTQPSPTSWQSFLKTTTTHLQYSSNTSESDQASAVTNSRQLLKSGKRSGTRRNPLGRLFGWMISWWIASRRKSSARSYQQSSGRSRLSSAEDLLKKLNAVYHGLGSEPPSGDTCVASVTVHGTGQNLQMYSNQIIVAPYMNGSLWEQLLGRTHRQGQQADLVSAEIVFPQRRDRKSQSTFETKWVDALSDANYLQETTGNLQKILYADKIYVA